MGNRLFDGHDIGFADIAEPFPVPYIREIYAEIIFAMSIPKGGSLSACLKWVAARGILHGGCFQES